MGLAVLAAVFRYRRTAVAIGLVAVLVLPATGYVALSTFFDDNVPQPPPPATRHCVEYSGGDTRCPG